MFENKDTDIYVGEQLRCDYCKKPCSSQSGLTLHMKKCKNRPRPEDKMTDIYPHDEEFDLPNGNDINYPSMQTERNDSGASVRNDFRADQRDQDNRNQDRNQKNPFASLGAFSVMANHVPVYLEIGFAIALGEFILDQESDNGAIRALGHQLKNLDIESD